MAGEVLRARPYAASMTSYSLPGDCLEVRTHASAYLYLQSLVQYVALPLQKAYSLGSDSRPALVELGAASSLFL